MARMKPQMTPEQQTAYRQAVAQKVIDSIPYEKYCAITPEQAAKQIKAWEKSQAVDFNQPRRIAATLRRRNGRLRRKLRTLLPETDCAPATSSTSLSGWSKTGG